MRQRKLGWIALVLSLLLFVTACGGGNTGGGNGEPSNESGTNSAAGQKPEASKPAEPVTLKVAGYKSGAELGAIPELNEKFMKENPDIKIVYEGMPGGQFRDFLKARFAANDASDVIMIHPGLSDVIAYGNAGYLMDLSGESWIGSFTEASLKSVSHEGQVYAIPNDMNVLGVYYNQQIFDDLSIDIPQNWSQFVEAAEKIKQSGQLPISIGNNDGWMTLAALFTMAPGSVYAGQEDFDAQLNAGTATFSEGWAKMLEQWFSLEEAGYLTEKSTGVSLDQAQQAFATGKAAMYIDGNWSLPGITSSNPDLKVGMFPMPSNDEGRDVIASAAVGTTFAINKSTKAADAAKRYLAFWSETENQKIWAKSQQAFMTIKGETGDVNPSLQHIAEVVASGKSYPFLDQGWAFGGAATTELMNSAQGVYLKVITPKEMLANMDKAWKTAASNK
ncbi:extracellular solute-binding protein [Paenibacillus sp. J5C_2022]|uniref:ABC transporter substrate-binding protein n=1 Tax=Paenibacillus sp. J5C2022 TaxID=2977129 RepID=UPI0021CF7B72|nr:extracellular solute-binding protein [Paenibacillus sp. J5C2022]MCU6711041.1 extracellular solute-binding protein [Paenibacillus sp. J5C2022]